ncbi:DUF1566 domain-containing protein [Pelomonas sp. SE-A7]|uniref:Lcl C-terminal domain-containing protein n=1 Tax=Pelomonas sp. SE-A7 TaxID=3054953 RepID=UPI00259D13B5|nr:DUF1566 domain-containing protein [Pelomonas sp. SE-A7]MDM4766506.1 DUF1566 domain-containing protein [Pelomonas sp. SE-A7]
MTAAWLTLAALPAQAGPDPGWTDPQSGLVWARCVEGMQWNGKTCTGEPLLLTLPQALARAAARAKEDGLAWRLPRIPEFRRLVEKAGRPPGLDAAVFPAAPRDWHWTATVNATQARSNPYNYGTVMNGGKAEGTSFMLGWALNTRSAETSGEIPKSRPLPVRLLHAPASEPSPR